jgi:glyceraldehyde 3-phosphate dehydrogenase
MRIAINGMGRIGRLLFRRLLQLPEFSVVAVNDLMEAQNLAYLLKYDSVYGTAPYDIKLIDRQLVSGQHLIQVLNEPDPSLLPWAELNVDVVLECTGTFTKRSLAEQHLHAGARQVILSTTGSDDIPLFIYGIHSPNVREHPILSPGGCMTNCIATLISAIAPLNPKSVQLNVIHSYTSRQQLVDAPARDFRRGRAAAESIIPVEVDLAG